MKKAIRELFDRVLNTSPPHRPPRIPRPLCTCGHCRKCFRRAYVRQWRKRRALAATELQRRREIEEIYRLDILYGVRIMQANAMRKARPAIQ